MIWCKIAIISTFIGPVGHRNKILRSMKEVKKKEIEDSIPDEFLCPITRELMTDPVIAAGTIVQYYNNMSPHNLLHIFLTNSSHVSLTLFLSHTCLRVYSLCFA